MHLKGISHRLFFPTTHLDRLYAFPLDEIELLVNFFRL